MAGADAGFLSGAAGLSGMSLRGMEKETELQKLLADEKMRCQQHKTNYQTLKLEHSRLQEEYLKMQQDLKSTIEEFRGMQEDGQASLQRLTKENAALKAEVTELKTQVLDPRKLEVMKIEMLTEVERPFKERVQKLNEESERLRNDYNRLRYEHSFMKSEYEHQQAEHQRVLQELKLTHDAEVTNLRQERESLIQRMQAETSHDTEKLRTVQRDNAQLNLKVKGLLTELEELRAQREHLGLQADNVSRIQQKQLTEHQANIRGLETEKETLKAHNSHLQSEINSLSEQLNKMTTRTHEMERQIVVLSNRNEELEHRSKVDITNLKMEMVRRCGDVERERDQLSNQIEDLQSRLEVCKHTEEQLLQKMAEKERECTRRVQAVREEEFEKVSQAQNDRLELESRLQELERLKIDEESQRHADMEEYEMKLRDAQNVKETAEKECMSMRAKLQNHQAIAKQLEQEQETNAGYTNMIRDMEQERASLVASEQELMERNGKLKSMVELLQNEVKAAKDHVSKTEVANDRELAQQRAAWQEERQEMQKRVDELDLAVATSHEKIGKLESERKKLKTQCQSAIQKLKNKNELLKAKCEELTVENQVLLKRVPGDVHNQFKKRLQDMMKRHSEFRNILASSNVSYVPVGDKSFATMAVPVDPSLPVMSFIDQETIHRRELEQIKDRLDLLDENQQRQFDEFHTVATSTRKPMADVEYNVTERGDGDFLHVASKTIKVRAAIRIINKSTVNSQSNFISARVSSKSIPPTEVRGRRSSVDVDQTAHTLNGLSPLEDFVVDNQHLMLPSHSFSRQPKDGSSNRVFDDLENEVEEGKTDGVRYLTSSGGNENENLVTLPDHCGVVKLSSSDSGKKVEPESGANAVKMMSSDSAKKVSYDDDPQNTLKFATSDSAGKHGDENNKDRLVKIPGLSPETALKQIRRRKIVARQLGAVIDEGRATASLSERHVDTFVPHLLKNVKNSCSDPTVTVPADWENRRMCIPRGKRF